MFGAIANGYDRANNLLSFGIHHLWRQELVRLSDARPGERVLDCATGTGDLALAFKTAVGSGEVIGTDFCPDMLNIAPAKAAKAGLDLRFEIADVTALPYPDGSFDVVSIAVGIRNVDIPRKALSEMIRVLRPKGRLLVLEFGQPQLPIWRDLYGFYSRAVLPRLGGWVTGRRDAYEYLQRTSSSFPCRDEFLTWIREAGPVTGLRTVSLSGGIAYIYKAVRASARDVYVD